MLLLIFNLIAITLAYPQSSDINSVITLSFGDTARNSKVLYQTSLTSHRDLEDLDFGIDELIAEIIDAKEQIKDEIYEALGFEFEEIEANWIDANGPPAVMSVVVSPGIGTPTTGLPSNSTESDTPAPELLTTTTVSSATTLV